MAIDLSKIKKGKVATPPRLLIYGEPGIGKTTFGVSSPDSILMNIETGGADRIDCARLFESEVKSYAEISEAFKALAEQEHGFKWLVVDTVDWLENLFMDEICRENKVARIDAIAYGKGYQIMLEYWGKFLRGLEYLQKEKSMGIILIAHNEIQKLRDPMQDPYDRHGLSLNKNSAAIIVQWVELIGFAHRKIFTTTQDEQFGKKVLKGVGTGERVLNLNPGNEGFLSKSRFNLPDEMPLDWAVFEEALLKDIAIKKTTGDKK